jgi:hypothetical protein
MAEVIVISKPLGMAGPGCIFVIFMLVNIGNPA